MHGVLKDVGPGQVEEVRLPGKGNSNSHGARPDHLFITMIKRIRTSRLSIKHFLFAQLDIQTKAAASLVSGSDILTPSTQKQVLEVQEVEIDPAWLDVSTTPAGKSHTLNS